MAVIMKRGVSQKRRWCWSRDKREQETRRTKRTSCSAPRLSHDRYSSHVSLRTT